MPTALALFIYFIAFFAIGFAWRTWIVYRRTGINPLVLPSGDDAHSFIGRAFKGLMMAIALYACLKAALQFELHPPIDIPAEMLPWMCQLGWTFLGLALPLIWQAQGNLGNAWRVGFDQQATAQLVQVGLYRRSRNPIFLAMRIALLGLFCISPDALTLLFLMQGELLMQVQVRLEENYLRKSCGEPYKQYCLRV